MTTYQQSPHLTAEPAVARVRLWAPHGAGQPRPALASAGFVDHPAPVVDDDGLLRYRDRWVALTDLQVPIVRLLVAELGRMVSIDELRSTYAVAGGSADDAALRTLMHRVGGRITRVGASVSYASRRAGMMVTLPAVGTAAP